VCLFSLLTLSLAHSLPSDRSAFQQEDLAILYCYNYDRECVTNLAIFAEIGPQIFQFLAAKIYSPSHGGSQYYQPCIHLKSKLIHKQNVSHLPLAQSIITVHGWAIKGLESPTWQTMDNMTVLRQIRLKPAANIGLFIACPANSRPLEAICEDSHAPGLGMLMMI